MKTVIITQAFEGYPDADDKPGVHFAVTGNAIEVPDEFADMIVGKGLAQFGTNIEGAGGKRPVAPTTVSPVQQGEA